MPEHPAMPTHSLFGMLFLDFFVFSPSETGFTTRNRNRRRKIQPFPQITEFPRFVRQKTFGNLPLTGAGFALLPERMKRLQAAPLSDKRRCVFFVAAASRSISLVRLAVQKCRDYSGRCNFSPLARPVHLSGQKTVMRFSCVFLSAVNAFVNYPATHCRQGYLQQSTRKQAAFHVDKPFSRFTSPASGFPRVCPVPVAISPVPLRC